MGTNISKKYLKEFIPISFTTHAQLIRKSFTDD